MKNYSVIKVFGRQHVICPGNSRSNANGIALPDANYQNTKKALCGVLAKGVSLNEWKDRKALRIRRATETKHKTTKE